VLAHHLLDAKGLFVGEVQAGAVTLIPALRPGGEPERSPAPPDAGRGVPQQR
jgi:hypothetical protein